MWNSAAGSSAFLTYLENSLVPIWVHVTCVGLNLASNGSVGGWSFGVRLLFVCSKLQPSYGSPYTEGQKYHLLPEELAQVVQVCGARGPGFNPGAFQKKFSLGCEVAAKNLECADFKLFSVSA